MTKFQKGDLLVTPEVLPLIDPFQIVEVKEPSGKTGHLLLRVSENCTVFGPKDQHFVKVGELD